MDYYELKLTIHPNTEVNRDVVSSLLAEIGFESFLESEQGLDAFVPEKFYSEKKIVEVLEKFPLPDTHIQYQIGYKKDQNWNEEWEKNFFQPIIIDNQVVIHSSFHKNIPKLQYEIVIDPKMAFGTGHHSTTELMVSCLLELDLKGKSFLDMGCGTAVLAILAKKKGASPVIAIDIDKWAYENSLENIRLNHTLDITVKSGDATLLGEDVYDVIFANINRNILLKDIPVYASCIHSGSSLFMSGFYRDDLAIIEEECKKHHLRPVSYKEKDNWVAVRFCWE
ncbi:MAG: 50S ribosomal protein L11 methyltransferase [Dysgonamonadaceae bacterium]|jgi:ribosomal protein L11 methyltransferase|nr:50S ribosomal protein L11 methyltransferase [Dysgonamonadaceae bacterium]